MSRYDWKTTFNNKFFLLNALILGSNSSFVANNKLLNVMDYMTEMAIKHKSLFNRFRACDLDKIREENIRLDILKTMKQVEDIRRRADLKEKYFK